jgi:hypothetical protein
MADRRYRVNVKAADPLLDAASASAAPAGTAPAARPAAT